MAILPSLFTAAKIDIYILIQNEVYYKNPLKNVICVLRDGLKQYRRYELNIGMVDNENRDD